MARVHYEKAFADYLGAPNTIWLGRGIFGDDTHGHVDDLTRFVRRDTVVTMVEPNTKDVNHEPLRANLRRLQSARDQDGKQLTVVELPMAVTVARSGDTACLSALDKRSVSSLLEVRSRTPTGLTPAHSVTLSGSQR